MRVSGTSTYRRGSCSPHTQTHTLHTSPWRVLFNLIYCMCSDSGGNLLGDVSHMTIPQLEEWGVGLNVGIAWEEALHGALMPITPQASMGSLADGE